VVLLLVAPLANVLAQTPPAEPATRAEALRLARDAKQKGVSPYTPNALERALRVAEERVFPLNARDGIHIKLGSLTTGSGFAYGGGYRNRQLFDHEGAFTVWAAGSLKKYWAVEGRLDFPDLAGGKFLVGTYARRHSYPQEAFFGVGPDARRGDHTTFSLENTLVGGTVGVRPARVLKFSGGVEYSAPRIGEGAGRNVSSISGLFSPASAPGLAGTHDYVRTSAAVELDYRQPKNARRGGWYRAELSNFHEGSGSHGFRRADIDLRQYASVLAERRVFAVRLFMSTSDAGAGESVPFYLMPSLGGHDSLRGFRDYRFRGPHAILTQSEYRFEIWSGLDGALFYDAGKVALQRRDLDFKGLQDAYGFGFRFNTDNGVILRIDAGFGSSDGKHLYIVFGDVF
jgi:hypothetical protein